MQNKKARCRKQIARRHSCHKHFWGWAGRVVDPVKVFLKSGLIIVQKLFAVYYI